jgi:hypothetical protein
VRLAHYDEMVETFHAPDQGTQVSVDLRPTAKGSG